MDPRYAAALPDSTLKVIVSPAFPVAISFLLCMSRQPPERTVAVTEVRLSGLEPTICTASWSASASLVGKDMFSTAVSV